MEYKLTFEFVNIDELTEFVNEQNDFNNWKLRKQLKKAIDNRGAHQKEYHKLAKEYQEKHPTISYRECLKEAIKAYKSDLKKE